VHSGQKSTGKRKAPKRGDDRYWSTIKRARLRYSARMLFWGTIEKIVTMPSRLRLPQIIDSGNGRQASIVDDYWGHHSVWRRPFLSKKASLDYIFELTDGRPLKRQLLGLHGPHTGKVILDYGCGPGNDLAGFAEFSDARKIIGVDVSRRALRLARSRTSWHARPAQELVFIQISDKQPALPIGDAQVDYIQSLGVIHHASDPTAVLRELARVLRPNGEIRVMLYNADSVHIQVVVGYNWRLRRRIVADGTPEEIFEKNADLGAPIAHCVRPADVAQWCQGTGLASEFLGGYFVPGEIESWQKWHEEARSHPDLTPNQAAFLNSVSVDSRGYPHYKDRPAGLGGVYRLTHSN
jgi:SAM-dependent methyltransferase